MHKSKISKSRSRNNLDDDNYKTKLKGEKLGTTLIKNLISYQST